MSKHAKVYVFGCFAGVLDELDDGGYRFSYTANYLERQGAKPVSLTMPLQREPYLSKTLFPFFDGLIPEGWLLNIAAKNWKIDPRDRMELLLHVCGDCIGSVHIEPFEKRE
jgi:serine/threonine-protein kinase HipA